ncbi:HlyD family secretion protein [Nostoc sp. 106C]|uniref:HlyD family secretion protein n=1 Tax=Nostoc sp. 106C TaxID=1932667 RepID=UPI000A370693|nr:HlyD family secretion protein [Nostoc sp. 106C]OUL17473.1 secretion protein HlyD [Nostoc sp. 106C]
MNKYQSAKLDVDLDPPTNAVNDIYVEQDDTQNSSFETDVELDPPPSVADPVQNSNLWQRRAWLLVLGVITLGVATVIGWRWWQFQHSHISTDNAQIQGHVSPIAAKISATVQKIQVKEGDYVKAGQPLIILENEDLNLNVQQAEANLAAAQAQLQSAADTVPLTSQTNIAQIQQAQANLTASQSAVSAAKAEVTQAQAVVDTNRAKVVQAQTEVNKTQADFRRYETLYAQGAIAAQQRDTARAAWENAQASLSAAKQTVAQAQAQVNNAQAQLQKALAQAEAARGQVAETRVSGQKVVVQKSQTKQAQAQVAQAAAALALARQQIKYTVIQAPLSGYVGKLTAQVGQKVDTGQPLLSIVPLDTEQIYVDANFRETTLKNLYIGEPADIEVDAYPGEVFRATVAGISPATGASFALLPPDNATGNFNKVVQWLPVRLNFNPDADPQHKLRAGLSVKVTVNTTPAKYGYKH